MEFVLCILAISQESAHAQYLRDKDARSAQNDYTAALTMLNRTLKAGRVAAAVARRKYDKAVAATSRVSRRIRKVSCILSLFRCKGRRANHQRNHQRARL